ncbi:hypothetical protein F4703DRAFT_1794983 [Phycomyces blakesleeanus]|uniref:Uncharacterized protein n=1 Tax=Phycomyces blakesleeanus (strain ATCC 8743b / DSM 1359 / FGSC 10004 / NBRC 33097 / NRRL 1555) TaxID=763407 RepID=A0A163AQF2_PHYB8|nr:hypothetical protein PHYBLDRAFT_67834 [Phycomyces blakesleeanus NRRL 1555(-)]OAD75071.1 hypothetical protein PHYBLDRAFT_67834 [Phycomyces blakesleeanus NRRL 1555(-)]|eukprot:XP_018293111.1 hypothetical protein PHYBLDRAFT_67834 [Phycomyces blakesleeanus NRRL 1555(-)]
MSKTVYIDNGNIWSNTFLIIHPFNAIHTKEQDINWQGIPSKDCSCLVFSQPRLTIKDLISIQSYRYKHLIEPLLTVGCNFLVSLPSRPTIKDLISIQSYRQACFSTYFPTINCLFLMIFTLRHRSSIRSVSKDKVFTQSRTKIRVPHFIDDHSVFYCPNQRSRSQSLSRVTDKPNDQDFGLEYHIPAYDLTVIFNAKH